MFVRGEVLMHARSAERQKSFLVPIAMAMAMSIALLIKSIPKKPLMCLLRFSMHSLPMRSTLILEMISFIKGNVSDVISARDPGMSFNSRMGVIYQ